LTYRDPGNIIIDEAISFMMRILAVVNNKGGVGKSTTCINLGASLGEMGYKVLLVDIDPQASLTVGMGLNAVMGKSMADVMRGDKSVEQAMQRGPVKNIWVAGGRAELTDSQYALYRRGDVETLKEQLASLNGNFDFTIIDCGPGQDFLTTNALVAADRAIIPTRSQFFDMLGVGQFLNILGRVLETMNPSLKYWVAVTFYEKSTRDARENLEQAERYFGPTLLRSLIKKTVKIAEAPAVGLPVTEYAPRCEGAEQYRCMAREIVERLEKNENLKTLAEEAERQVV